MGSNKITPNVAKWLNDPSITKQDAHDAFGPDAVVHDLTQTEMASDTSVLTKGGVSTQDGAIIYDVLAAANTPTRETSIYDTTLSRKVAQSGRRNIAWASLPATGQIGEKFLVTDLNIEVEFRNAADDALISGTGITGWHPTAAGLFLAQNETGSTIEANRVVAFVGTTATRRIAKTTVLQQQDICGVTLQSIATGTVGVVAGPGFARPILIQTNASTVGVTADDVLVASGTAGVAQSVGPQYANPLQTAPYTFRATGTQYGAFARALATLAADGTVMCQMLGFIGQGLTLRLAPTVISTFDSANRASVPSDGTTVTTLHAFRAASGTAGGQAAPDSLLASAKHVPFAAFINWNIDLDSATASFADQIKVSPSGGLASVAFTAKRYGTTGSNLAAAGPIGPVPLDSTLTFGYTNNLFSATLAVGTTVFALSTSGYIC